MDPGQDPMAGFSFQGWLLWMLLTSFKHSRKPGTFSNCCPKTHTDLIYNRIILQPLTTTNSLLASCGYVYVCVCLCKCVCVCVRAWVCACLLACLPACLPACLFVCLFFNTYLLIFQISVAYTLVFQCTDEKRMAYTDNVAYRCIILESEKNVIKGSDDPVVYECMWKESQVKLCDDNNNALHLLLKQHKNYV